MALRVSGSIEAQPAASRKQADDLPSATRIGSAMHSNGYCRCRFSGCSLLPYGSRGQSACPHFHLLDKSNRLGELDLLP